ncbi:unnamed protein product [Diabrotica balteata]|uniref:CRAL-TRIO domain-containing protein n=1 Tax=Diabrotica balteata TaxID=107213 RepID=A0A9N9SVR8_DIABA|nr:unnamed protein product [Diabrotica balteata]
MDKNTQDDITTKHREAILKYLGKSEEDLAECVKLMKSWFKTQPHLPEVPNTKKIEFYVVNNTFNLESAKTKIDQFYTSRSTLTAIFDNSNPKSPEQKAAIDSAQIVPLPKLYDDLYGVILFKMRENIPVNLDPHWWLGALVNAHEVKIHECLMLNYIVVYDLEHMTLGHLLKITPMFAVNSSKISENGLGERLKEVHFINCPPFFQIIMNILRAVMRADFFSRLHIHHTVDSFRQRFPSELLPKDYGGNEKCMDELEAAWIKKYEEYQEHFDRLDTLRVDESLRPNPDVPKDLIGLGFDHFRKMFFDS